MHSHMLNQANANSRISLNKHQLTSAELSHFSVDNILNNHMSPLGDPQRNATKSTYNEILTNVAKPMQMDVIVTKSATAIESFRTPRPEQESNSQFWPVTSQKSN